MRVVFVSWRDLAHPHAGGSEILVDRLACGLLERGHEVALISGGPVAARPYVVYDAGGRLTQYVTAPRVARRQFADWDLVVDVSNGIPYFAPLWRDRPSLLYVHHEHGAQWAQHFRRPVSDLGRFLEREVVPRVYSGRLVVTGSASTVDALGRLGVPAEAIRLITIGVDCPTPKWEPSPTPLFLALGRLVPHKRIDVLLRAWREVEQFTGGRLVVAGDGPALEAVRHLATPSVEFTGLISEAEKQRLLEQAWLLVHTAQHEGWGMVVMEAAAVGTPALAFDVDGVRDSVVHGSTGVLVEEVDELVAAWIALAADAERREALGIAARVRAATFSWGTAADEFEAIALEACARDGSSSSRRSR